MPWLEVLVVIGAGIPFAPERDGSTFLGVRFGGHDRDASGRY